MAAVTDVRNGRNREEGHDAALNIDMRYHEFAKPPGQAPANITEADAAEAARKAADRQIKARKKISDAQSKKADASRSYQDQMRKADDSPSKRRAAGQRYQDRLRSANDAMQSAQQFLSKPSGR